MRALLSRTIMACSIGAWQSAAFANPVQQPSDVHVKVMVHNRSTLDEDGRVTTSPTTIDTSRPGLSKLDDQPGYVLYDLPRTALEDFRKEALNAGAVAVEDRDDFDLLAFASLPVDARVPMPAYPEEYSRSLALTNGARDQYVLQFSTVPRPEWITELERAGGTLIDYVPRNAYTVLATSEAIHSFASRFPLQLLRLHQGVHKISASLRSIKDDLTDVVIVLHQGQKAHSRTSF